MDDETTEKVIDGAMRGLPTGASREIVARAMKDALADARRVALRWASVKRDRQAMVTRHAAELGANERELAEVQGDCRHAARKHYSGALPGEGYTQCLLCGAEV